MTYGNGIQYLPKILSLSSVLPPERPRGVPPVVEPSKAAEPLETDSRSGHLVTLGDMG